MHHRLSPVEHRFHYRIFQFYLDLEEIDAVCKKLWFMSRNRFNLFSFRDKDHLQLPREAPDRSKNAREHLLTYLDSQGVAAEGIGRIMLLTNLCTLGYQFNPVSFYYCFGHDGQPLCSVVEICNTFREMKPYFLSSQCYSGDSFRLRVTKNFYVSPFIDLDARFDFDLHIPDERLRIKVDDYSKEDQRFFISTLSGKRSELTDARLLLFFLSFPLITLKVIGMIHLQALVLWLKKLPWHRKNARSELQQGVYRPYKN